VAVIGAAREPGKVGHVILANLLQGGFAGEIYPINPKASEILGLRAYASVKDLPSPVDLAVVAVPACAVPDLVTECAAAGITSMVVISAGFSESGPEGAALEREVAARGVRSGIRILGPNCLGLISTHNRLNASFAGAMPPAGGIAFISQSGALGTAIIDRAATDGFGLSHFVSIGNRADVAEPDLLTSFARDPHTNVIAMYIESVADGESFLSAAEATTRVKPVIALKSGTSDSGARAVSSHTGSLAGSDAAFEAAFRWAGIIRARSIQELFDYAAAFSMQPLPARQGIAILTNAGGPAVMATDSVESNSLSMASFDGRTIALLRSALPAAAAVYNPVDVLGDADAERYRHALRALYADPGVGAVLIILTPQAMTEAGAVAEVVVEEAAHAGDVATLACFMGGPAVEGAHEVLVRGSIPHYATPERAIASVSAMYTYARVRHTPSATHVTDAQTRLKVAPILDSARVAKRTFVTEESAAAIVEAYGVRTPPGMVVPDRERALAVAAQVGYPVALKIASPDILHKSDVGGLKVGIRSPEALSAAYDEILGRVREYAPDAVVDGVHVQRMAPPGREVIIGVDRDPVFGPMLMFGLGGVYVEVLKDVTFRLCPVDRAEAERMIADVRSFGLLRGARGQPPADLSAVASAITAISSLVLDFPQILELDINPLIVGNAGEGVWAADVRIGIGGT
jgi:acetyltransferase